jgi:hypothetical protein
VIDVESMGEDLVDRHNLSHIVSRQVVGLLEVPVKVLDLQVTVSNAKPMER